MKKYHSRSGPEARRKLDNLSVTMVSSEVTPFAHTGGLGEVIGSLPKALERLKLRVSIIMPAYRSVLRGGFPLEDTGIQFKVPVSSRMEEGGILKTRIGNNITVYFIRADRYFDRECLYGTAEGDYPDNAERFVFFARAALEVLKYDRPDILHAHDWQSALTIAFLKAQPELYPELADLKTVFTVHNLGYQGLFRTEDWHLLNLKRDFFTPKYLEFYGKINFLKGGLVFADTITTVSPTYAEEIKTDEQGFGLDGVFRERASSLRGILNGVDYEVWNPAVDTFINTGFNSDKMAGKSACKADLQQIFGLAVQPEIPVFGMVSRLTTQKGADLLEKALDAILTRNLQFVLLGSGDKKYQEIFSLLPSKYPGQVGVRIAFDEALAHKIIAGADMLLMPSRYEPGGLAQVYGLKYGTIPVVRATGGLRDTVKEFNPETGRGNGFVFSSYEAGELLDAIDRVLSLFYRKEDWMSLVKNAMQSDFSWSRSARAYAELYRKLAK